MRYCWETLKRLISAITQLCYSCVIYVCSFIFFKKQTFGRFCKLPNASIRPCLCNCNKHHILFNTLDAVVDFPQTALNLYLKYVKTFQMSLWIRCLIWELRYHHMPFTHHPLFPALLPFISFLSLLRVFNDIVLATDGWNYLILVFTRLIAFATVGHIILIFCLEHFAHINGTTLNWCKSYLAERTFCYL